jgi:transcriptional regulator with XRE-family HTH domain
VEHPVLRYMRRRGIRMIDVAEFTGYSLPHVSNVLRGIDRATPAFRSAVAQFIGAPEDLLFHDAPTSHVRVRSGRAFVSVPREAMAA